MELNASDWVLVITTLFLGIIALIAPAVSETIKRKFYAPKITPSFVEKAPFCHKTFWRAADRPDLNEPVYFFRFKVENTGSSQLRQCEAILEDLWIYNAAGKPEKVSGFIGVNLKWASNTPEIVPGGIVLSTRYVNLNPRRAEYCNIGRISSRKYQKDDEEKFFVDIPGKHKPQLRFLFEQGLYPNSQTNCLLPGKYAIKVKLFS